MCFSRVVLKDSKVSFAAPGRECLDQYSCRRGTIHAARMTCVTCRAPNIGNGTRRVVQGVASDAPMLQCIQPKGYVRGRNGERTVREATGLKLSCKP